MNASTLVTLGGICHFGILTASALVPLVLDWKRTLADLPKLVRQLVWVYGGYVVMTIVAFGLLSVAVPHLLTDGNVLGRIVCGFIATFWGIRLLLQAFYLDSRAHLTNWWLTTGHHLLTVVFVFLTLVYAWAAIFACSNGVRPRCPMRISC